MKKGRQNPPKEAMYVWTGGDIQRVEKEFGNASVPAPAAANQPPAATGSIEHRRYPRLDLKLPILYKVLGQDSSLIPSNVRPYLMSESTNVSALGLCLNLPEEFAPGTVLALSIHMVDEREKFSAVGRVLWTQASTPDGHFLTGVQFVVVEGESVKKESQTRMEEVIRRLENEPPPAH